MLVQAAMRGILVVASLVGATHAGCSTAQMNPDGVDAARTDAAALDADEGVDAAGDPDAAADAGVDGATLDAGLDGPAVDAAPCTISAGHPVALDGVDDLGKYLASQRLTPGAPLAATDEVALTWDATNLYVTVRSEAFLDGARPLHVYVEAAAAPLGTASPVDGKEYGGHVARLPFGPNYLIAVRRTNDFGTGGYDAVYVPAGGAPWTSAAYALEPGARVFASSDDRTLSVSTPWAALGGCPLAMRVSVHVVNGAAGNEWKDLVPATHAPWLAAGGGYYEIDLTADPASSGWVLR